MFLPRMERRLVATLTLAVSLLRCIVTLDVLLSPSLFPVAVAALQPTPDAVTPPVYSRLTPGGGREMNALPGTNAHDTADRGGLVARTILRLGSIMRGSMNASLAGPSAVWRGRGILSERLAPKWETLPCLEDWFPWFSWSTEDPAIESRSAAV